MSGAGSPVAGSGSQSNIPPVQYWEDFAVYEIDSGSIANGVTNVVNLSIQQDSAFKWMKSCVFADLAGAPQLQSSQVIPLATLQITDLGSGRNLFSIPSPIGNVFGLMGNPLILPIPRRFKPFSQIQFTFANFSAGTTYSNIRLSLIGTKIFRGGPPVNNPLGG
jgi:hypothetical protein